MLHPVLFLAAAQAVEYCCASAPLLAKGGDRAMSMMDGEMGEGDGMKTITNRRGREGERAEGKEE